VCTFLRAACHCRALKCEKSKKRNSHKCILHTYSGNNTQQEQRKKIPWIKSHHASEKIFFRIWHLSAACTRKKKEWKNHLKMSSGWPTESNSKSGLLQDSIDKCMRMKVNNFHDYRTDDALKQQ
jgi:hypothetical protein